MKYPILLSEKEAINNNLSFLMKLWKPFSEVRLVDQWPSAPPSQLYTKLDSYSQLPSNRGVY